MKVSFKISEDTGIPYLPDICGSVRKLPFSSLKTKQKSREQILTLP